MSIQALESLLDKLNQFKPQHSLMEAYYEGSIVVPKGHSIPPFMNHVQTVVGWPSTAVDVLEERLDFLGWEDGDKYGMAEVYEDNGLYTESGVNHLDAMIHGCGFVHVGSGDDSADEPDVVVTILSPNEITGVWNPRTRRLSSAVQLVKEDDGSEVGILFETDRTVYYRRGSNADRWKEDRVDLHRLGRVPVVFFPNRVRGGRRGGRSEVTRAIRSYTDMAVRTLLGMEVNREFFSAPQRYVLGAKEDTFVDESGNPVPGWKAIMGHLWGIERDEAWVEENGGDGLPVVGQFDPVSPGPYLDQIRGLSQLFSAEAAIPPTYLGFSTDSPPSADAIRALEARLVKRAERRQSAWTSPYIEIAQLVVQIRTGTLPAKSELGTRWGDPATPTRAADADRAVKLVGAGILPAESSVTRSMVGLTVSDQKRLERDANKATLMSMLGGTNEADAAGAGNAADEDASSSVEGSDSQ